MDAEVVYGTPKVLCGPLCDRKHERTPARSKALLC
jgi:hypothetical protein